jgi:enamine deaminase RidA (YjgF/YER057c/UK114 family)
VERDAVLKYGRQAAHVDPRVVVVNSALVDLVCDGNFPWAAGQGAINGTQAAQRYYARQYRRAKARLDRAEEEVSILKEEVIRLQHWLEYTENAVEQRIKFYETQSASDVLDPKGRAVALGKVAILKEELSKVRRMFKVVAERKPLQDVLQAAYWDSAVASLGGNGVHAAQPSDGAAQHPAAAEQSPAEVATVALGSAAAPTEQSD